MGRRTKEEEQWIIEAVKKYGMVYNDDQLGLEIQKAGKLKHPPSPRSVRRWRRKVLDELNETSSVRMSDSEQLEIFKDSLETYKELKRQCFQDIARAQSLSIYKTMIDRNTGQVVFQRDPNGHIVQDINATRNRNYMLAKSRWQLQSAQYQIDRLMRETGNFVPKVEKPTDEMHFHLNMQMFTIAFKNILRIIIPLFRLPRALTEGEIGQVARLMIAEVTTEEGASPYLEELGLCKVELLTTSDIPEDSET